MTLTFVSNFLNHHQLPLCRAFIELLSPENFHFVACERIKEERVRMGYEDMNEKYSFVIKAYQDDAKYREAAELVVSSDVVILGSCPNELCKTRLKNGGLTFRFCERIFKNGTWHRFIPTTMNKIYQSYTKYRSANLYILCASAYLANDLSLVGFPRRKCFKWGYFPKIKKYTTEELLSKKADQEVHLLWVGRMIWWKHPEDALYAVKYLSEKGIECKLTLVGEGEKKDEMMQLSVRLSIQNRVVFRNFCSESEVRSYMESANIYIFSSGKQEGWGAVLNEAMNSACVIIANNNAGSTPYLIQHKRNGLIYNGSRPDLYRCLDLYVRNKKSMTQLGLNAYESMSKIWNADNATKNFMQLISELSNGIEETSIIEGPCSLA